MSSLSGRMNIWRVNIEFFPGWKKIQQRRISFVLGYLRMILWKNSTAIYLYGFLNQSLGLILGNLFFFINITACVPLRETWWHFFWNKKIWCSFKTSERAFSIIKKIHTEFRSHLNNDTICGFLSCKFNQNQCCYEYQPSHDLLLF